MKNDSAKLAVLVNEDLAFCGYNMLITSEIHANPEDIYKTYHNLWRIEESFRIMKSYLEARPAFLSNEDSIKGHFLICYFSLTLLRLLELKILFLYISTLIKKLKII